MVAVLLLSEHDAKASEIFQDLSAQGIRVVGAAHTAYLHHPRSVCVLDWQEEAKRQPALHPSCFVKLISEQT